MIKFFRKIRQRLLTENKFSKYLFYAIGEIVLVVIGILIALSINNWNENRKLRTEEIKALENFKISIGSDLYSNNWHKRQFDVAKNSINLLIEHMESDLPYQDSLKFHFGNTGQNWEPYISYDAFEMLKSGSFSLISNEQLRSDIVTYYSFAENAFEPLATRYSNIMEHAQKNIYNSRFNASYEINLKPNLDFHYEGEVKDVGFQMIPNDYEDLKKDKEYMYFLKTQKNQLYWYMERNLNIGNYFAENLYNSIDKELSELKK